VALSADGQWLSWQLPPGGRRAAEDTRRWLTDGGGHLHRHNTVDTVLDRGTTRPAWDALPALMDARRVLIGA
jgi:hypothetical protein